MFGPAVGDFRSTVLIFMIEVERRSVERALQTPVDIGLLGTPAGHPVHYEWALFIHHRLEFGRTRSCSAQADAFFAMLDLPPTTDRLVADDIARALNLDQVSGYIESVLGLPVERSDAAHLPTGTPNHEEFRGAAIGWAGALQQP